MHFNLTPLIIISRTSRFSLSSCPSQDKHNLFAIKPNKYVCVGDRNCLGRVAEAWAAGAGPCVLEPCPRGSHCLSFQAGWPELANENIGHPVKFEFQVKFFEYVSCNV